MKNSKKNKSTPKKNSNPAEVFPDADTSHPIENLSQDLPTEIRIPIRATAGLLIIEVVPLEKFLLALECSGSFLQHFTVDKISPHGNEGRALLMTILEPLLGKEIHYSSFLQGINQFLNNHKYDNSKTKLNENGKRFLGEVQREWAQKKRKNRKRRPPSSD